MTFLLFVVFAKTINNENESVSFDSKRLRASTFSVLKLIEIVILWVNYAVSFSFSLFRHFWSLFFNFLNFIVWLRITDEGSVPEMRI